MKFEFIGYYTDDNMGLLKAYISGDQLKIEYQDKYFSTYHTSTETFEDNLKNRFVRELSKLEMALLELKNGI